MTDLLAHLFICQKYLKGSYTNRMKVFWKKTFTPYVALEKVKMCYAGM